MSQTPVQVTREAELVAKYVGHELTGSSPALSPAERAELAALFAVTI